MGDRGDSCVGPHRSCVVCRVQETEREGKARDPGFDEEPHYTSCGRSGLCLSDVGVPEQPVSELELEQEDGAS